MQHASIQSDIHDLGLALAAVAKGCGRPWSYAHAAQAGSQPGNSQSPRLGATVTEISGRTVAGGSILAPPPSSLSSDATVSLPVGDHWKLRYLAEWFACTSAPCWRMHIRAVQMVLQPFISRRFAIPPSLHDLQSSALDRIDDMETALNALHLWSTSLSSSSSASSTVSVTGAAKVGPPGSSTQPAVALFSSPSSVAAFHALLSKALAAFEGLSSHFLSHYLPEEHNTLVTLLEAHFTTKEYDVFAAASLWPFWKHRANHTDDDEDEQHHVPHGGRAVDGQHADGGGGSRPRFESANGFGAGINRGASPPPTDPSSLASSYRGRGASTSVIGAAAAAATAVDSAVEHRAPTLTRSQQQQHPAADDDRAHRVAGLVGGGGIASGLGPPTSSRTVLVRGGTLQGDHATNYQPSSPSAAGAGTNNTSTTSRPPARSRSTSWLLATFGRHHSSQSSMQVPPAAAAGDVLPAVADDCGDENHLPSGHQYGGFGGRDRVDSGSTGAGAHSGVPGGLARWSPTKLFLAAGASILTSPASAAKLQAPASYRMTAEQMDQAHLSRVICWLTQDESTPSTAAASSPAATGADSHDAGAHDLTVEAATGVADSSDNLAFIVDRLQLTPAQVLLFHREWKPDWHRLHRAAVRCVHDEAVAPPHLLPEVACSSAAAAARVGPNSSANTSPSLRAATTTGNIVSGICSGFGLTCFG